ncbi:unnamed protein product [marine sediment metagenome]|uniref:Uncharacterized protein n=1 Tax=marine sediment metagenome TaxID=412755 RepID=X0UIR9_9ZZZZ
MRKLLIRVYLKNGVVFEYEVRGEREGEAAAKAREHVYAIATTGYRHNDGVSELTWYAPHWIDKIKIVGTVPTNYPDRVMGT